MSDIVKRLPTYGFARGAVVRKFGQGPNMLVVRQLEDTTCVIIIEGDEGGKVRMREVQTHDMELALADHGRQDHEFDLRWQADMRAIDRWRASNPGNELVMPDHVDLVCWLLDRDSEAAARIEALEAALRPFANLYTEILSLQKANPELPQDLDGWALTCKGPDLRAAAALVGGEK